MVYFYSFIELTAATLTVSKFHSAIQLAERQRLCLHGDPLLCCNRLPNQSSLTTHNKLLAPRYGSGSSVRVMCYDK